MGNDWRVLLIKLTLSDIIFKQHQTGEHGLNILIIILEFLALIAGVIVSAVTPFKILPMCAVFNIVLVIVMMINNKIHTKAWEKARKDLDEVGLALIEMGKQLDEYELEKVQKERLENGDDRV